MAALWEYRNVERTRRPQLNSGGLRTPGRSSYFLPALVECVFFLGGSQRTAESVASQHILKDTLLEAGVAGESEQKHAVQISVGSMGVRKTTR